MARRSSLLLLAVLIQPLGPTRLDTQLTLTFALPGFVPPAATCTMRVMPVDPSIDQKMLKKPDTTKDYTLRVVPPPCQASHPAPAR